MKTNTSHSPKVAVKVVAGLFVASQVASIAEEAKVQTESLEPTTIVATKFEKKLSDVSQSVEVLDVEQLKDEGHVSLQDAIGYRVPGVIANSSSGQRGQLSSLLIRGTTTKYSQVRVDGVRVTDSKGNSTLNYLGVAGLEGADQIEILKGSSSSLYGGGAIGGVVSLSQLRGEGDPQSELFLDYGSFNSVKARISSQGEIGDLSYNIAVTEEDTDNDTSNSIKDNHFNQFSFNGRFDYNLGNGATVGATVRSGNARFGTPEYGNPALDSSQFNEYDYLFATLFYENQVSDQWTTRLTAGLNKEDYDSDGYGYQNFDSTQPLIPSYGETNVKRYSVYWDNEFIWSDRHVTNAGLFYEDSEDSLFFSDRGFGPFAPAPYKLRSRSAYLSHSAQVIDNLTLNSSVSIEEHDAYDNEASWTAGALLKLSDTSSLKFNAGSAFRAPDNLERARSNDLNGERSFTWDVAFEQQLGDASVEIAWFETDIDDFITPVAGSMPRVYENSSRKEKTSGLEFTLKAPVEALKSQVYASYTYLDKKLDTAIPTQTANIGITTQVTEELSAGFQTTWVDTRLNEFGSGETLRDYFLVNLNVNYQVCENVKLHARIENLLDDAYELYAPSPFSEPSPDVIKGRGRGFYGGATITF